MNEKKHKEYDEFMNEQFRILHGHFGRCMLRVHNKYHELENSGSNTKVKVKGETTN